MFLPAVFPYCISTLLGMLNLLVFFSEKVQGRDIQRVDIRSRHSFLNCIVDFNTIQRSIHCLSTCIRLHLCDTFLLNLTPPLEWHYLNKWAQIICEYIPILFSFDEMDHLIKLVYDIYWGDHVSIKKPGILVGHPWKCMHPEKWYHNESDHL